MSGLSVTIPGWVVAAVILSVVWFFVVRTILRAVEKRYWLGNYEARPSQRTIEYLTLLAGPVIWIIAAVEAVQRRTR